MPLRAEYELELEQHTQTYFQTTTLSLFTLYQLLPPGHAQSFLPFSVPYYIRTARFLCPAYLRPSPAHYLEFLPHAKTKFSEPVATLGGR